jgi:hypothetical protein
VLALMTFVDLLAAHQSGGVALPGQTAPLLRPRGRWNERRGKRCTF